ncbi:sortase B [Lachnospiraceae bacterium NE2001]|nr:sortase B [Lachnospiraceae bacterium NE2001]
MKRFWIWMNIIYEKLMLVVFLVALLIVIYGLYDAWYVFNKADDDSYLKYKPVAGNAVPENAPFTEYYVAWVTVDDTTIDFPVMQGDNNMKYLNVNPYGEYSLSGSIFLDSRNTADFSDDYSILYGHHMEYGVMFGALDDFLDKDYLKEHSTGTLIVGRDGSKSYKLGIFASMKVNVYEKKALDPVSLEEISRLIEDEAEVYNTSINKSDHILTLSTCTEPVSTNRLLVFCYIYED